MTIKYPLIAALALTSIIGTTGCSSATGTYAAVGAAVGTVAGALLGGTNGAAIGAAAGAGIGAGAGYLYTNAQQRLAAHRREMEEILFAQEVSASNSEYLVQQIASNRNEIIALTNQLIQSRRENAQTMQEYAASKENAANLLQEINANQQIALSYAEKITRYQQQHGYRPQLQQNRYALEKLAGQYDALKRSIALLISQAATETTALAG